MAHPRANQKAIVPTHEIDNFPSSTDNCPSKCTQIIVATDMGIAIVFPVTGAIPTSHAMGKSGAGPHDNAGMSPPHLPPESVHGGKGQSKLANKGLHK